MEKRIIELYRRKFDDIRHEADGIEYWYARELMKLLDYVQWRNFDNAINKAMISCENNGNVAEDHFSRFNNTIEVGNGALREVEDYMLTRYACYLIAENGDPRKEQIAFAQCYFAVQTRKQELIEERISYIERTEARGKLRESEKRLSQNIYERGVDDAGFGRIRSKGDQALFGGFTTKQMKERLGVQDKRPLADFLPTLTIAAKNLATEMKIIMLKKRTCKENLQSLLNMWKIILLLETCLDKEELNRKIYQHRKTLRNWNVE